ncbi:MAG: sulfite exporter TauE/SafE family protein [Gemmatimonadetes bacterium]|nr:sulfite exporter TauE/SafE family protein [Gemmatimonadota bacterium]
MLEMVLLAAAGTVAGVVNVVAGGGSLLTIPLLIFFGLPATVANGTNRVAILVQNVGATASFHRRELVPWVWMRIAAPASLVGAGFGTWTAISVGDLALRRILAVVMVVAALFTIRRPAYLRASSDKDGRSGDPMGSAGVPPGRGPALAGVIAGFFAIGFYGGLIQAGIGFLALAVFSTLGVGLIRANALKVATILVFTPLTLVIFWMDGSVDWGFGAALALGNFAGGLIGVRLQVLKGNRWVAGFVTVAVIGFAVRLVLEDLLRLLD